MDENGTYKCSVRKCQQYAQITIIIMIKPFFLKKGMSRVISAIQLLELSSINMMVNNADQNRGTMLTTYSKLELNVRTSAK